MICSGVSSQKITGICRFVKNSLRVAGSIGSRITDLCVNKHDFDSQSDRSCGGNSGTLSVEMGTNSTGIGRHNLTEPVTWYYKYIGSRT